MATKYWVGNGGNWSDIAHWSLSSGGPGGASVPTKDDPVVFDSNSITSIDQIVFINVSTAYCNGIDFSAITTSFTFKTQSNHLNIFNGDLVLSSLLITVFLYSSAGFRFVDGTCGIYCNSATCKLQCFGDYRDTIGATVIPTINLQDAVIVSVFSFSAHLCVFNTNNIIANVTDFTIICYEESIINLGSSIINCSGGFEYDVTPGAIVDAGTSSIVVGNYISVIYRDDRETTVVLPTLNNITFNRALSPDVSTAELWIQFDAYELHQYTGKFYCANLTVLPGYAEFIVGPVSEVSDISIIASEINISGSDSQQLTWRNGDSFGKSLARIMMDSGEVSLDYVTLKGISASGTAPTGITNICVGGVASALTSIDGYSPADAFDGDFATDWEGNWVPNWIQYDLGISKVAKRYIIRSYDTVSYCFVSWTFEGSNDGSNWTILDTKDHTSPVGIFVLDNTEAYRYYRWNITECGDSDPDATELWILEDSEYEDGATFYARISNGCVDGGGNAGWFFEPDSPTITESVAKYNEGDHMAYAPGDSGGTAVWREAGTSSTPITDIHRPGCGYWFKETGTVYGGEVGPWVPWNVDQKVEFNEGSRIVKSPTVSGGTPIWEVGKTGPAITDTHVPCGYWFKDYDSDSQLRRICFGLEMGYTKTDMVVDEQQTLYVKDSNGDTVACPITVWTLSGVGSLSESVGPTTVYTAPSYSEAGSDSATITLWCGGAVKDTLVISVAHSCDCLDIIEYTSLQMSTSQQQTLSASGAQSDECYSWQITSGGGSLSAATGKSVIYTAPSSNANCSSNPTITLTCGGSVVDTITMAVNEYGDLPQTAYMVKLGCYDHGVPECPLGNFHCCTYNAYNCEGTWLRYYIEMSGGDGCDKTFGAGCDAKPAYIDSRTTTMKTGGCCPAYLI